MTNPKEVLSDFEEKLWVEVMEEYVITAELGHLAKNQLKHKEEMRQHFKKLKQFIISSQISTLTSQLEAIPEKEEYPETGKITGNVKIHRILGINQERQRQRQDLQLAIKEWSELK